MWTSGEAELAVGSLTTDVIEYVHYELAGPHELGSCLADLTHRLTKQN